VAWRWRRRNFEREMAEELRAHVAHRADDLEAAGTDRPRAERQARIELGSIETHKEHIRDERSLGGTRRFLEQTANDLRLGARRLRHAPLYAVFAIGSIGLGAGATTAMFSIVRDAFWAPSGIHEADRVVIAANQMEGMPSFDRAMSIADFEDYRQSQTSFDSMAAATRFSQSLSMTAGTQLVTGEAVSDAYFQTLGITSLVGRVLQPADSRPDAPLVMVLGHQVWRRWFASDPGVVGQVVRFGATSFQIVGVATREYRGLNAQTGRTTGVWISLAALSQMPVYGSPADPSTTRTRQTLLVAGRLKDEVTPSRADAEAATIGSGLDAVFPLTVARRTANETTRVPGQRQWIVRPVEQAIPRPKLIPGILVAIVALILIVACTNLANLSLARGASREAELAVRVALGASRGRLIRELCAESLIVGAGGYVLAVLFSAALIRLVTADWPALSGSTAMPDPHIGLPVLVACAIAVLVSILVFGLSPALQLSRTDVRSVTARGGATVTPSWRTERQLIGVQTVVSVTLFCAAAGLISALGAQNRMDPGIDLDHLTVARTAFRLQTWDAGRSQRAIDAVTSVNPATFGFRSLAVSSSVPFGGNLDVYAHVAPTSARLAARTLTLLIASTPQIFDVLGLPLIAGRPFDQRDIAGSDPVIVISETSALMLFGSRDVIGRDVYLRGSLNALDSKTIERRTVIGVTKDTDVQSLMSRRQEDGLVFVPLAQRYEPPSFVLASRTSEATGDLRALIRTADPDVAVDAVGSGLAILAGGWIAIRIVTGVALLLGASTLVLTMAGLFGVLSALVLRRSREIGIRKAMGADDSAIRRMILRDGARPVAAGTLMGLFLGVLVGFLLRATIPAAVQPFPLVAALIVALTVVPATLAACYFPARRAMRMDPNVTLKDG